MNVRKDRTAHGDRSPYLAADLPAGAVSHRAAEGVQPAMQESGPEYFHTKAQRRKVGSDFLAA